MWDVHKETKLKVCGKREYERDLGFEGGQCQCQVEMTDRNHTNGWHSLIMLASHISTSTLYTNSLKKCGPF